MIGRDRVPVATAAFAILGLVVWMYSPVRHSGFVWDDSSQMLEAWLRGHSLKDFAFRGFSGWINYFRPLVILLFAFETWAFDLRAGPMHVVSLGIHLANTALVGLLALRLASTTKLIRPAWLAGLSMLAYGLHPGLIEPVDWIGCQFELTLVFFILLGLLFNATIRSAVWRAIAVGLCFLFAAGCKEAAIAFPPLLVLFDLIAASPSGWPARAQAVWKRQHVVYAAVLLAGIVYLAVRYWALGYTVLPSGSEGLFALTRLQRVCLTYLSYWKLIVWPMASIGLLHSAEPRYAEITAQSLAIDITGVAVVLGGIYAFWKRWPLGSVILAVSIALLPVLNLIPIGFNEGLYHDRYATTAIAMGCVLLPSLLAPLFSRGHLFTTLVLMVATIWLGFAIVNIRVTVPLWADELALWRWALQQDPQSITAKDHLLSTYISRNDHMRARELADELVAQDAPCPVCMLNAASLAISENDAPRAARALHRLEFSKTVAYNKELLEGYVLTSGGLLELQGDLPGAEEAYRYAIALDPLKPLAQLTLATLLAKEGRIDEARKLADIAIAMFAPDEREQQRAAFERALAPGANARRDINPTSFILAQ